jgi:hypothetical protein
VERVLLVKLVSPVGSAVLAQFLAVQVELAELEATAARVAAVLEV